MLAVQNPPESGDPLLELLTSKGQNKISRTCLEVWTPKFRPADTFFDLGHRNFGGGVEKHQGGGDMGSSGHSSLGRRGPKHLQHRGPRRPSWHGRPFTPEGGSDEEWQEWVNWDEEERGPVSKYYVRVGLVVRGTRAKRFFWIWGHFWGGRDTEISAARTTPPHKNFGRTDEILFCPLLVWLTTSGL